MRSLQLIWVDLKSTSILVRYTQRQQRAGGEGHEKMEAGCRDATPSQAILQPPPAGRGREGPPQNFYGSGPLLTGGSTPDFSTGSTHLSHHLLLLPPEGLNVHLLGGWIGQLLEAWQVFCLGACCSPEQPWDVSGDPRRKVCVEGTHSVGQFVGGRGDGGGQTLSSCALATLRLPLGAVLRLMGKGFFLRYKESRVITSLSLRACSVPGSEGTLRPEGGRTGDQVGRPRALSSCALWALSSGL